ncbi:hypothetical protein MUK42_19823 [Musa troglodytarum]|uniref:Uncharacterized protein n=1 Tax=Musa troglodytarum TaxID=320322 RepID=A0A9E7K4Q7_9LILI|nr:hypothetical protein MUK42_19823 [Musa troglodytarum]
MAWFYTERGPPWKRGWTQQTLSSISFPPPQLIAVFAIVVPSCPCRGTWTTGRRCGAPRPDSAAAVLPPGGALLCRSLHFLGREVRVPAALAGPGADAPCAELAVGGSGVGGIAAGDGLLSALVPFSVAQAMEG